MEISDAGLELVKSFEGCRLEAYPDPGSGAEPWTIGYGHTGDVHPGDACNQQQADAWLRQDLRYAEAAVSHLAKVDLTQGQFDALVSFTFNCGQMAFGNSTLLRLLNSGDVQGAAGQFGRWNKGPNGPMPGLTRRRAAEQAMFEGKVLVG